MVKMKQKYTKKIVKIFDSLIENTLFKLKYKINSFISYYLKKSFSKIENTLFKLNYKINSFISYYLKKKFTKLLNTFILKLSATIIEIKTTFFGKDSKVSNLNKFIITLISLLFIYLFYLSIPTLYDKAWVQQKIESELLDEFKIDFSTSSNISYYILPVPHFLIKDTKIIRNDLPKKRQLSEIKKLKVFISQKNFFIKEKINITKILIEDANFSLKKDDIVFLNKASNKKFSTKKIKIINSNIFFKNNLGETITLIKVPLASVFFDDIKKLNKFDLFGEIFKIPFVFDLSKKFSSSKNKIVNIDAKKLKLNILNESSNKSDNDVDGLNIITVLNSKIHTNYNIKKDLIVFELDASRKKNSNIDYQGKLSLKPFDLKLNIILKKYDLSKLLDVNSVIGELVKTQLLFNENISAAISVNINSNKNDEIFKSSVINFNIINGKINFDKTKLINKKIGFLEVDNSSLFFENDKLILNTNILVDIHDSDNLFSLFQTPRKARKAVNKIFINLDYDLLMDQVDINNITIDSIESNNKMLNVISEFNNSNDYNLNKSRRIFNKLFSAYSG